MQKRFRIDVLSHPSSWYFKTLEVAAKKQNVDLRLKLFSEIQANIVFDKRDSSTNTDAIIVRSMPLGSLEQVIFRMDALRYYQNLGVGIFNSPSGLEAAIDKALTLIKFHNADIPFPPTGVFQSADDANIFFQNRSSDVVVKPIFGSEGRGLIRISEPEIAQRVFTALERTQSVIYCQEFVSNIVCDIRILLIGEEHFAVERRNAKSWISNAAMGGETFAYVPSDDELRLARAAAKAVEVEIAGVDLLRTSDNKLYVIEVNAVPGWKALNRTLNKSAEVDVAGKVIDFVRQNSI